MVLMIDLQLDGDELKPVRVASKKEKAALTHSENENGTEEKKKLGKPGFGVPQISFNEADSFEDQKKVALARSKTIVDNSFLMLDGKNDSKAERKKHSSNQFKANAHFHKLFLDVLIDEPLKQNFTCALQKEIMYQGKLYVSENWICFHSNVFGKDIKITIPVLSVTLIKKTKTALLVPNALIITTVSDRYMFVSFLSRDTVYKLLKSICSHLENASVGNSPNPSPLESSFRADCPTTLSLDFSHDFSELDGIIQRRRKEMEESSSTGSQTPELEHFQDYHKTDNQSHFKSSKTDTKDAHKDVQSKYRCDDQIRNVSGNISSGILGSFDRTNFQLFLSVTHILIVYAILVFILICSTFYMRYKVNRLEEQLVSMASTVDPHMDEYRYPIQGGLGYHQKFNVDGLYAELTANLIKLEKIQSNLQKLLEDNK
ncbi:GRAM domain-containing protein 2B isoform X1 [Pseudonaja textilis]|uniref:GRAM domain-containing protein 2B isoform X1 n=1 Tax=Pseudonaja textilis TaxID=8673 RepID=UPI000EAA2371|nr:GRAM domain-containing protein 2B isoform X1 [Pseudonaja textilis]